MPINLNGSYVIYIESPEHCEKVQRRLFELGCEWTAGGQTIQCTFARRLFVNYGGNSRDSMRLSYSRYESGDLENRFLTLRLEDLYDTAEPPPTPQVKIKPTSYSKWHIQCLAKHILAKYPPTGIMKDALVIMERGYSSFTEEALLEYALKYESDRPKDLPPEILDELRGRKDA